MTQNDFLVLARVVVLDAAISPRFILQDKIGQVWLFLHLIVVLEHCCGCFSQHFCAQGSYGKVYLAKDRLPKMDTFVTVVITNIPLALIFKS